ncbi:MAG: translation initiation factor IF-2 [Bacilli bacterium]|nr:translation initiation factor IF-2 [Bacilli bacterium]
MNNIFIFSHDISLGDLAEEIDISSSEIVKFLFLKKNKSITVNQLLSEEIIKDICDNFNVVFKKQNNENCTNKKVVYNNSLFRDRPPVITIMGHVDHGKTTLIDAIRNSNEASKEIGGISQIVRAYQKDVNGRKITFIDTPGHEAFSNMRKYGAQIADIIVLVVAADDGVKPQTVEAIKYAKKVEATILVAINKIDKPSINIEKVNNELSQYGLAPEKYGGENIFCEISAKKNIGIDNLLNHLLLLGDLLELKTDINNGSGVVLEAKLSKNVGIVTNILIQNGILENGCFIVIDNCICGHIKKIFDDNNKVISSAGASMPVKIIGLKNIAEAGQIFLFFKNKLAAEQYVAKSAKKDSFKNNNAVNRFQQNNKDDNSIDNIFILNLILKADAISLLEAIKDNICRIKIEGAKVNVIYANVGDITDNDIDLANLSKADIFVFNIKSNSAIKNRLKSLRINTHYHNIIYSLIEDVEETLKKKLAPKKIEVITGHLEIKKIFTFEKKNIAGCIAKDGFIKSKSKVRLIRNGEIIHDGVLASLRHKKDDISIVKSGSECGTIIKNYNDIKENDIIEGYEIQEE